MRRGDRPFPPDGILPPPWRIPAAVTLAILAIAALAATLSVATTLTLPAAFGNEGWSAYHQAAAAAGRGLYPPPGSLMYNDYPPLSFYLGGYLGRIVGDNVFAGRMLSFAGFLLTAAGVAAAARRMGCTRLAAGFALLLFVDLSLYDHGDVGTNDPQFLGHALDMAGLLLCLRAPRTPARLVPAALCFVLAFFFKANLVALPLAVTVWLLCEDRRNGLILALFGLCGAVAGTVAFQLLYERSLWSVLDAPRIWLLDYSLRSIAGRLPALLAPLLASLWLLRRFPTDASLRFCLLYLALALAIATYFLGGAGTGGNLLFDSIIALALCGGIGVSLLLRSPALPLFAACHVLPLAVLIVFADATDRFPRYWLDRQAAPVADVRRDVEFLKAHDGPALCRILTLCYWAGKPAEADLWGYEQAVTLGQRDGHELRDAIRTRRYGVLQLGAPPNALDAWPEVDARYARTVSAAIEAGYRIDHSDSYGVFWVRRAD